jgi:hypothetical protein
MCLDCAALPVEYRISTACNVSAPGADIMASTRPRHLAGQEPMCPVGTADQRSACNKADYAATLRHLYVLFIFASVRVHSSANHQACG